MCTILCVDTRGCQGDTLNFSEWQCSSISSNSNCRYYDLGEPGPEYTVWTDQPASFTVDPVPSVGDNIQSLTLNCNTTPVDCLASEGCPQIHWMLNSTILKPSNNFQMTNTGHGSVLTISSVVNSTGRYRCVYRTSDTDIFAVSSFSTDVAPAKCKPVLVKGKFKVNVGKRVC